MNVKRICVDLILVLALAFLGVYCYRSGKAYDFTVENTPHSRGDVQVKALEAVQITVDGEAQKTLYENDIDQMVVVGSGNHRLTIDILDLDDKPILSQRREYSFAVGQLGDKRTLNVPFAYSQAQPVR